jgi:hypothetical protein
LMWANLQFMLNSSRELAWATLLILLELFLFAIILFCATFSQKLISLRWLDPH